jgi:hypothetical protein
LAKFKLDAAAVNVVINEQDKVKVSLAKANTAVKGAKEFMKKAGVPLEVCEADSESSGAEGSEEEGKKILT